MIPQTLAAIWVYTHLENYLNELAGDTIDANDYVTSSPPTISAPVSQSIDPDTQEAVNVSVSDVDGNIDEIVLECDEGELDVDLTGTSVVAS